MNAQLPPAGPPPFVEQFAENIVRNSDISMNLGGHIITTTEDKVRLAVLTHLSLIDRRQEWIAPAGILLSIVAVFVTATFKDAWLPAATWEAVFFLAGMGSLLWLIRSLFSLWRAPSVDDFVNALKTVTKT